MLITLRGLMVKSDDRALKGMCWGFQIFGTKRKKKNRVLAYKEAPNTSSKFNYDTLC